MSRAHTARQRPPIVAILFLVVFLVGVLYFVATRQLKSSKAHRLRLLAGFSSRVEATVPDLARRFVRIVQETEDARKVRAYVDQIPYLTFLPEGKGELGEEDLRPRPEASADEDGCGDDAPSLCARPRGSFVYLVYLGPGPHCAETPGGAADGEGAGPPTETAEECARASREVRVRLDLEALLAPAVLPEVFDSILVASAEDGKVLFQQGEPELRLTSLRAVVQAGEDGEAAEDGMLSRYLPDPSGVELGTAGLMGAPATGSVPVEVAEVEYRLFFQPIVLELPALRDESSEPPVSWVVGGFVSSARLLSASFTSSPVLLAALLSIFPLGLLSWPFLKLWLVSPRQRLTRVDVTFLVLSTLLGCFFLTLLFFGLSFRSEVQSQVDRQLEELADRLEGDLFAELGEAYRQLEAFEEAGMQLFTALESRSENEGTLFESPDSFSETLAQAGVQKPGGGLDLTYPIFHSVFQVDECGEQKGKVAFREHSVRKTSVYGRGYFRCLAGHTEPFRLEIEGREEPVEVCLESVISNTGGADQVILALPRIGGAPWRCPKLDPPLGRGTSSAEAGRPPASDAEPYQLVMATRLAALTQVVLPPSFGFAVVETADDGRARVLLHSDPRRILSEDLLKASDEDAVLASLLSSRRQGEHWLRYWGRRHRAHIRPFPGLPWALVTFRSHLDLRMRSIELLYDVANPTLLLFVPFYLLSMVILGFTKPWIRLSLWPDYDKNAIYRWIVLGSLSLVGAFALLLAVEQLGTPRGVPVLLFTTLLLPAMALLGGTGAMVVYGWPELTAPTRPSRWSRLRRNWVETVRSGDEVTGERKVLRWAPWPGPVMALAGAVLAPSVLTISLLLMAVSICGSWLVLRPSFRRQQRRSSYIFALSCLLLLVAVLPAVGLYSLARGRQWTFIVQETQEGLQRALETHRQQAVDSYGDARRFFEAYSSRLDVLRRRWLSTFFATRELAAEDGTSGARGSGWPWEGRYAGLFSPRPVPANDLSAEPRGVDLSRFETPRRSWWWQPRMAVPEVPEDPGEPRPGPWVGASLREDSETGAVRRFFSRVPLTGLQWTDGALASLGHLLLGLLWIASPGLLVWLVAHGVLFVSLASVERDTGQEGAEGEGTGGDSGDHPDLGNIRNLLNPDNLRQDRMLLVLGVPELALQAVKQHLTTSYHVLPWDEDGPGGAFWKRFSKAAEEEAGKGKPVLITRFHLELDVDREAAEKTTRKLHKVNELYRQGEHSIVLLADVEPRRLLTPAEVVEEDPASQQAAMRREWSALLGSFTFRYAADQGNRKKFGQEVRERRMAVLSLWRREARNRSAKVKRAGDHLERLEAQLKERRQELERRKDDEPTPAAWQEVKRLEERVVAAERALSQQQEEADREYGYEEALAMLRVLERECRPTGKLQEVGSQVLREVPPADFEAFTREKLVAKIALLARAYYQAIWASTSEDEKVVLAQLAHTGLVSPRNRSRVLDLMYRGLVVRDPALRLMNDSFALFIRQTVGKTQLLEWEGEEATSVWSILRWLLPVPLLLLGGFVFITQRDAVSSAIGFLIAAASVAPTLINLFGYFEQRFAQRVAREERERARALRATGPR